MQIEEFGQLFALPIPDLTPYALGIASQYEEVLPWYCTVPTNMTGVTREHRIITTTPVEDDVLIIAAHCQPNPSDTNNGQYLLLQVNDLKNGLFWSTPNAIFGSPVTAYAGVKSNRIPVIQLPEAYFMRAGTSLRHQWKTYGSATGGTLTWIGVRLQKPIGGVAPEHVVLPDGPRIKIGSRMPWFDTIGLGEEVSVLGSPFYGLGASAQFVGKSTVMDCGVYVTGLSANWFTQLGVTTNPENLLVAISDSGNSRSWQIRRAPAPAVLGSPETFPMLPFTKPYFLPPGHSLKISVQNQNATSLSNPYLTIHGIRLCEF